MNERRKHLGLSIFYVVYMKNRKKEGGTEKWSEIHEPVILVYIFNCQQTPKRARKIS